MARKIDPTASVAAPVKDTGAADLATLHPDVELDLAGRHLIVREYRFNAGYIARAKGKPITDDLVHMIDSGDAIDADVESYLDLLARHEQLVRELMATSIDGADADFIAALDYDEGELLLLTWWNVCGRFFVRRALRKLLARAQQQAQRAASAGSTSSPPLPAPSTAAPSTSESATPSAS